MLVILATSVSAVEVLRLGASYLPRNSASGSTRSLQDSGIRPRMPKGQHGPADRLGARSLGD